MTHSLEFAARVVNVARSWIDTPFHHQGRQKGIGCDCLGLIMGIAAELQIPSRMGKMLVEYDRLDYHYRQDAALLLPTLLRHLQCSSVVAAGCVIILQIQSQPRHLGIVAEHNKELSIIHACMRQQKVIEQPLRHSLQQRIWVILTF